MNKQSSYFAQFSSIAEVMPDALAIIDTEGRICLINQHTETLFGYTRQELVGEFAKKLLPLRFRGNPLNQQALGLKKDGTEFPFEMRLSLLKTEEGTFTLVAVRDMTERRNIENTLKEKNIALEQALLAKDTFLANMSHELRTPLNAILGFTGTLLMKLPGPLNEEQEKQLNTIKRGAQHLFSLINDLLNLAKIESGKADVSMEPTDCDAVITEVVTTLLPTATVKGLKLNLNITTTKNVITTDRHVLAQIVTNLVNNAIKFTEKGEVNITLEQKKINHEAKILIHVIDTGMGIRTEDQRKLFTGFLPLSPETNVVEGAGLGLHLSQKLANLLHGDIDFESEFGSGSRFSLILPVD